MDHVTSSDPEPEMADVAPCACGGTDPAPWRLRDTPSSPASLIAGLLVVAFGVAAVGFSKVPAVGWVLLGLLVGLTVLGGIVTSQQGHRGPCLVGRSLWTGVAWLGLPLRVVAAVPF